MAVRQQSINAGKIPYEVSVSSLIASRAIPVTANRTRMAPTAVNDRPAAIGAVGPVTAFTDDKIDCVPQRTTAGTKRLLPRPQRNERDDIRHHRFSGFSSHFQFHIRSPYIYTVDTEQMFSYQA